MFIVHKTGAFRCSRSDTPALCCVEDLVKKNKTKRMRARSFEKVGSSEGEREKHTDRKIHI